MAILTNKKDIVTVHPCFEGAMLTNKPMPPSSEDVHFFCLSLASPSAWWSHLPTVQIHSPQRGKKEASSFMVLLVE